MPLPAAGDESAAAAAAAPLADTPPTTLSAHKMTWLPHQLFSNAFHNPETFVASLMCPVVYRSRSLLVITTLWSWDTR